LARDDADDEAEDDRRDGADRRLGAERVDDDHDRRERARDDHRDELELVVMRLARRIEAEPHRCREEDRADDEDREPIALGAPGRASAESRLVRAGAHGQVVSNGWKSFLYSGWA